MSSERLPLGLNLGLWDRMTSFDNLLDIVRLAEELGYSAVTIPESFARDGFTLCDRLLAATEKMEVCLALANVFSRSPAVLAQTAATLDELSGGRFVLGLGSSTPNLVEGWHGMRYERPLQRTREAIDICHRIWRRDRSPWQGEIFSVEGVKLGFTPVREAIPIWHGALLEKSLQLCGEKADGWIPTLVPVEAIDAGRAVIGAAAANAGREAGAVSIIPNVQLMVGEDRQQLLQMLKFGVAVYYGPDNSPYARAAAQLGYAEDVQAVAQAYAEGGSGAAIEATSDRLAASVGVVGDLSSCRTQVAALLDSGVDRLLLSLPGATRADCEPVLSGIIP